MMQVILTPHAKQKMRERGATEREIEQAILHGEKLPAKHGRTAYRKNFQYNSQWGGKFYRIKQVMPITKLYKENIVVITVFTFYF